MTNHRIELSNGWIAEFANQGEFRMDAEGWNLVLHGPQGQSIQYFNDQIVLVNDDDGTQAKACLQLSEDGVYGYLSTSVGTGWVIDFARGMLAPHRVDIRHYHDVYDESIALTEQPAFQRARQYIQVKGRFVYLTFPFIREAEFPKVWEQYVAIRRRQLDELYFRN